MIQTTKGRELNSVRDFKIESTAIYAPHEVEEMLISCETAWAREMKEVVKGRQDAILKEVQANAQLRRLYKVLWIVLALCGGSLLFHLT